ncbi:MAG: hypothetical protein LAT51_00445 [Flavobacteriaceae bacterium]|nr:hypothetical protein [Flavobacteriaceae bacterium]
MKKTLLYTFLLLSTFGFSQMKDISFTFSPMAEYSWWDNQSGLNDDFLYGGKVGFGFGEYLELSGLYTTNRNMSTDFSSFGNGIDANLIPQRDVRIDRYGGELKINLSTSAFSPYFTLGTGIQRLQLENQDKNEQIYASFGLGMRLALTNRINFLIEGRALGFQNNSVSNLLTTQDRSDLGIQASNYDREDLLNFSAIAALQIYLGGRKPGELSSLDKAYLNAYKNGFKGWSWVIEPSLGYLDFDSNSLYRDTYLAGGYFGVDFNEYVGVRAYFFQSMEDKSISLDFDRLNMYGLEFRAKLNDGKGVTPYLILGGGQLLTQSNYQPSIISVSAPNSTFANAGLGLDIPLGRNFLITGGVRAMASSERSANNLFAPEALQTHLMYNAGVKLQLGKKHKMPSEEYVEEEELEEMRYDPIKDRENYRKLQRMKREYKEELQEIDEKLERAYQQNNVTRAVQLLERKKQVEAALRDIERTEKMQGTYGKDTDSGEYLKMTPDEFESLINRILQGIDEKYVDDQTKTNNQPTENVLRVEKRLAELEKELAQRDQQLLEKQKQLEEQNKEKKQKVDKETSAVEKSSKQVEVDSISQKSEANQRAEDEMKRILDQQDKELQKREEKLEQQMKDLELRIQRFEKELKKPAKEDETIQNDKQRVKEEEGDEGSEAKTADNQNKEESSSRKVIFTSTTETRNNVGYNFIKNENESWMWDFLTYKGSGIYTGVNAGEQTSYNLGVRGYYGLGDSVFEAVPEAFVGFGSDTAFGLQMNAILPFTISKNDGLKAYVGTGGGVLRMDDSTGLNYNLIVGTYINWGRGRVFIDYTARNTFDNNHFSIGYRLPF